MPKPKPKQNARASALLPPISQRSLVEFASVHAIHKVVIAEQANGRYHIEVVLGKGTERRALALARHGPREFATLDAAVGLLRHKVGVHPSKVDFSWQP